MDGDQPATETGTYHGPYSIRMSSSAEGDLQHFSLRDQKLILDKIVEQLTYDPEVETRNRKHLSENMLAKWELRIGSFRVFYDVDGKQITIEVIAVGEKDHNVLFIRGKKVDL